MTDWVELGEVMGVHGLQGWLKVFSYTDPRENITRYDPLYLQLQQSWREFKVEQGRSQGKGVVVKLHGIDSREQAAPLLGSAIAIQRAQLPALAADEIYWADLEGLQVLTENGTALGKVSHLLATGSNDVLVVKGERERLIPFLRDSVVLDIDLDHQLIRVDWDPDF